MSRLVSSETTSPGLWLWDDANLLQHTQHILICPTFDELAVGDAKDGDARHLHALATGRRTLECALLRAE